MNNIDKINYLKRLVNEEITKILEANKAIDRLNHIGENLDEALIGQGYCPDPDYEDDGIRIVMVGDEISTKYGEYGIVTSICQEDQTVVFTDQHGDETSTQLCRVN